jgi:hypothetical protein
MEGGGGRSEVVQSFSDEIYFVLFLKTPETCHKVSMSVIVSTLHLGTYEFGR